MKHSGYSIQTLTPKGQKKENAKDAKVDYAKCAKILCKQIANIAYKP